MLHHCRMLPSQGLLLPACRGLRTLFNTLLSSLPAIFNVGSLLFLLLFVYAILGMNLFGDPGSLINQAGVSPHATFANFGSSMMLLMRVCTTDTWEQLLQVGWLQRGRLKTAGCTGPACWRG